jgi:hypothetical protein
MAGAQLWIRPAESWQCRSQPGIQNKVNHPDARLLPFVIPKGMLHTRIVVKQGVRRDRHRPARMAI